MINIAINGFGRIGRPVLRRILKRHPDLKIVAINDLTAPNILGHLLKFDSIYGIYEKPVKWTQDSLLINRDKKDGLIKIFKEADPINLPWKKLEIDIVLECTGHFRDFKGAEKHLEAGAKKVILSAPSKDPEKISSFILGVNADKYDSSKNDIVDMASCTTNCLAPILKVLNDNFKIVKGFMSTIHAYTNDQRILDLSHKDLRRTRAAALNIIPTTTGAAKAIGKVIPVLKGKLDGMAYRVPVPSVSVLDLICNVKKQTNSEEVNFLLKKASFLPELKGILGVEDVPLVSSDYKGNSFSAIVDADFTMVMDDLVKVTAWYDNEWAYACRLAEFAEFVGKKI